MKKLGALVSALTVVVLSAACASSGSTTTTKPREPVPGEETWSKVTPSAVRHERPAHFREAR